MTCPECELNKARAALWRHEAYKLGGTPLPWDVDVVIARAVAAEREECAKVAESYEPICDTCPSGVAAAIRNRDNQVSLQPSNQGVNHE